MTGERGRVRLPAAMQNIDPNLLVAAGVFLVILVLVAVVFRDRRGADLSARVSQLADSQARAQELLIKQLMDQERAVGERLDKVGRRVGESLEKSGNQTKDTLTALRERLAVMDEAQKNITQLSTQMVSLQDILSNKQARGAFGEIQLKDLVESALPASTYEFQATVGDGKRVDCLIRLPDPPGPIGIDAKFPLESFQRLYGSGSDAERAAAGRQLAADMRKHVQDIKDKYIVPGETAEAALLFLPSEAVYAELHANHANVIEFSFRARVYIVSPTTLWATLNTVRAVFKDVRMREQAGIIQKELHVMLDDVARLDDRVGKLESHFDLARRDINEIRISSNKVTRRAERIQELELEDGEPDADARAVESGTVTRLPQPNDSRAAKG